MKKTLLLLWCFLPIVAALPLKAASGLDVTSFVVVGGGWAAGCADYQLLETYQREAFPTLMARSMKTIGPQPLFRPLAGPALVSVDALPGILPETPQSVLRSLPFPLFVFNLSIPWIRVGDSLRLRPAQPFVHEKDYRQTMVNLVLGYPHLILDSPPVWTQVESAERMRPTVLLLQLGLGDVLEGAVTGNPGAITPSAAFAADFTEIARRMSATYAQVVVMTVPNPLDTPFFLDLAATAESVGSTPAELSAIFGLQPGDRITPAGLAEIGDFHRGRRSSVLTPDARLAAGVAAAVEAAVESFNGSIRTEASRHGFLVYDLNALARRVRESGISAGTVQLGGGHGEGFYSPDGLFPTPTAHAVIANELLAMLNTRFSTTFPTVDVSLAAEADPFYPETAPSSVSKGREPAVRSLRTGPVRREPRSRGGVR